MLKPLTSLRFLFAVMVFLYHIGGLFRLHNNEFLNEQLVPYLTLEDGFLGVSFFFILSGFILAYNYRDRLLYKRITRKQFILARIFRVYPLHLITFGYVFFLVVFTQYNQFDFWKKVISQLFLMQSFIPEKEYFLGFNGVSWSISNELFFYILFPFLINGIVKYPKFIALSFCLPLALLLFNYEREGHWLFYINPFYRVFDFILGIALHEFYRNFKAHNFIEKKSNYIELFTLGIFILFYSLRSYIPQSLRWSTFYWIPMSLIIFIFAFQRGFISKVLSQKWFIFLGEISFAFYMVHQLIIEFLGILQYKFHFVNSGYLLILLAFLSSIGISTLIYLYFEKPCNIYLRKKFIQQ